MRIVAAIQADLEETPLGTRSRLADELAGESVLRRTVKRVCHATLLDGVHVLCPARQRERCEAVLRGSAATVRPYDAEPAPWGSLVQAARKWSLDGWRGGIGGTTYFDEFTDVALLRALLHEVKADVVFSLPPAAPLIDPGLIDRMIEHRRAMGDDIRLTFTQAPPGLAGILLDTSLVSQLAEKNVPLGWLFSYKPDNPHKDLIFQPCCYEIPAELRHAGGRLCADTERSTERLETLLREDGGTDLESVGRWLSNRENAFIEPLPREVEIELTTDDPYPSAALRPRGACVENRGPIQPSIFQQVAGEVARYDDALVVLGGFGDPLRHPQFATILQSISHMRREGAGPYGVAVRTAAADLNDELIEVLLSNEVDVLSVILDAWSPGLYGRLQSPEDPSRASLEAVIKRLDSLSELREKRRTIKPILVPEMTKAAENVHELDDFHDGWLRRAGAVNVVGHSHYARQCEDHGVIPMAPSHRSSCRRIRSRCLILADGRLAMCDQDFNGRHAVGRIGEESFEDLWRNAAFETVREAHRSGRFDPTALCAACDEWHRP
jgi:hypothetical protein